MHLAAPAPWYRHRWPWLLMAGPAVVVVAGIVTAVIAFRGFDGPSTDDYYKEGLAINRELARSDRARELGLQAQVEAAGLLEGNRLRVEVSARDRLPPEAALRVTLAHPGRREADRVAILSRAEADPDGRSAVYVGSWQQGSDDPRLRGKAVAWKLVLETPEWRMDAKAVAADALRLQVQPAGQRGP